MIAVSLSSGFHPDRPLHWAFDAGIVTIMVGHDEETWDFAVRMPVAVVDEIVAHMEAGDW